MLVRVSDTKTEPGHERDIALAALLLTHTGISNTLTLGKIGYTTMSISREAAGLKPWTMRPWARGRPHPEHARTFCRAVPQLSTAKTCQERPRISWLALWPTVNLGDEAAQKPEKGV